MSGKIPPIPSSRFIKQVEQYGVAFIRQRGTSHAVYERIVNGRRFRAPIVTGKELSSKYMKLVLRQLGFSENEIADFTV